MRLRPTWSLALATPFGARGLLRHEQQLRRLDRVRGDHVRLRGDAACRCRRGACSAIRRSLPSAPTSTKYTTALRHQPRAGRFGARNVHRRVVLRLDRADRNAAVVAAARRAIVAHDRIASLRRRAHFVGRSRERGGDLLVEIRHRDLGHRVRARARRAQVLRRIARHADLVFRLRVPRLERRVVDRPIDATPECRREPEVVRHEPQAGAEPVPRRAADLPQVRAREFLRTRLQVVAVEVVGARMRRVGGVRIRALGHLDRRVHELAPPRRRAARAGRLRARSTLTPAAASLDAMSAPAMPAPTIATSASMARPSNP